MLEGKEVQGYLGEYGSYHVDAHDNGVIEAGVTLKVDVIAELRKLAKRSDNQLDDKVVDIIAALLAKKPEAAA